MGSIPELAPQGPSPKPSPPFFLKIEGRAQQAPKTRAPHTLQHPEQLLVGRVVERVNQIAHLRKLAFQLVEPRLDPLLLRTREHAQASELFAQLVLFGAQALAICHELRPISLVRLLKRRRKPRTLGL